MYAYIQSIYFQQQYFLNSKIIYKIQQLYLQINIYKIQFLQTTSKYFKIKVKQFFKVSLFACLQIYLIVFYQNKLSQNQVFKVLFNMDFQNVCNFHFQIQFFIVFRFPTVIKIEPIILTGLKFYSKTQISTNIQITI
ncbi:transmembrane protein, putative (macronuclear) [Tetrahymena thermophila SB210]|uniref:Transmembrane protein, putative n=1 Tax=Tetrahymena thermophila (strain SB210) TaxID=312017 RepID=W7WVV6_TETTS|nr:transmembrane protein, putative [Tetrahymena thermophila SB210]EWS70950.1 transmembrane protein, putative [Tetrahymena thermophila SB210]|eukprot:XP_012656506.1 transmembrane protein, putative [Tetrahymena thermophila SB210]